MFFDRFFDLAGGRLTYVFPQSVPGRPGTGEELVVMSLLAVEDDRHQGTEAGYLLRQLGHCAEAIAGRDPSGGQWILLVQRGPAGFSDEVNQIRDRARGIVTGLAVAKSFTFDPGTILDYYRENGIRDGGEGIGFAAMLRGLMIEMTGYPLASYAELLATGCGYPGTAHDCRGDVVADVFTRWQAQQAA